jgi:hypothetical protein
MSDPEFFRNLEFRLLSSQTRRDANVVAELLAEDFVEFGASGQIHTRQDVIDALPLEPACEYQITDFAMRDLGEETKLLTYRSTRTGTIPRIALRSSLWQLRNGEWKMVFHQGTLQKQEE